MAQSKSSRRWLKEHFDDPYVKKAQQEHYRSRAVYKLQEVQKRDKLIQHGMTVIDLGAAPGGWSQLAVELVGAKGKVIALDILPMDPLKGVTFILGDFRETQISQQLISVLNGGLADVILSDMAPNISGVDSIDQPRAMYLAELSLQLSQQALVRGGALLVKVFQGAGYESFVRELRQCFKQVLVRKPDASRSRSREIYLLAKGYMV